MRTRLGLLAAVALLGAGVAHAQQPPPVALVYSSLPHEGATQRAAQAIVRGEQLALDEAGGAAGGHRVKLVSTDDGTPRAGGWTPEATARDARHAAQDPSAVAYLGEFNSAASAVSIPIVNEAGLVQISPANTAIGLTRGGPGTTPGEPVKYYPTGRRQFFRVAPNDRVQGAALAAAMHARGCRRVAWLSDGELYGRGVGASLRHAAPRAGLRIVLARRIALRRRHYVRIARRVRHARAGCVAYTGLVANGAVALFRSLAHRLPRAKLFGGDDLVTPRFFDPHRGGVPASVGRRVRITWNVRPASAYPPAGQDFFRRYAARFGDANPDPYAIYGYEAMRVVLDAVAAVGTDRAAIARFLHRMPIRAGALGSYRFDRFGDTTLRTFGVYAIRSGALAYAGSVEATR